MEAYQFTNAFPGELSASLTAGATTLVLKSGHGANFPVIALGQAKSFKVCVKDKNGNLEIVKIIQRASGSDTLVVGTSMSHQPSGNVAGRAQEGTSALSVTYTDDHVVELRLTAGIVQDLSDAINTLIADLDTEEAALITHKSSGDHDGRYFTETELTNGQLDTRYFTETELTNGQLDTRYYTEAEITSILASYLSISSFNNHAVSGDHDGRYFTETELNNGQLDTRYYTEAEITSILASYLSIASFNNHAASSDHDGRYYTKSQVDTAISNAVSTHNGAAATGTHPLGIQGDSGGGGE